MSGTATRAAVALVAAALAAAALLRLSRPGVTPLVPAAPPPGVPVVTGVITRGPWIVRATRDSVTLRWWTAAPTESVVELGSPGGPTRDVAAVGSSNTRHRVTIAGLAPGTTYSYRLVTRGAGTRAPVGAPGTFTTAAAPDAPSVTFAALGDSGAGTREQAAVARLVAAETFDFFVHLGDVIYPQGDESRYDRLFFAFYGPFLASHALVGAVGNHDLQEPGAASWVDVFDPPRNNDEGSPFYSSFEWGDAKFVAIDSTGLFQLEGPWGAWLERELANNARRWLVLLLHAPLHCSDRHHGDDARLQQLWQPLLERHGVDLVLAGHAHMYQRTGRVKHSSTDPSYPGFVEVVSGGGGHVLYPVGGRTAVEPLVKEAAHHFVKVTLERDSLRIKAIRADGSVLDDATIPRR